MQAKQDRLGTFLEEGIDGCTGILSKGDRTRQKIMVIVTDGQPNKCALARSCRQTWCGVGGGVRRRGWVMSINRDCIRGWRRHGRRQVMFSHLNKQRSGETVGERKSNTQKSPLRALQDLQIRLSTVRIHHACIAMVRCSWLDQLTGAGHARPLRHTAIVKHSCLHTPPCAGLRLIPVTQRFRRRQRPNRRAS